MIPILYPKTETAFSGYGGQKLTDTISCIVTEERNGIFEVELIYPVDGEFFNAIEMGSFIFCGCSQGVSQPFEIYAASKPIDGKVVYYGQHITYSANYNVIKPFTFAGSAQQIMDKLASERVSGTGKAVTMMAYDIPGAKTYSREYPAGLRSCLGGTEGSLLDLFGGEYEWDYDYTNQRPKITLHNNRGRNHGVKILYGKNLTDLMQEESIQELFTGVVLYWVGDANGVQKCVYSDEVNISSIASYPYHRTLTVDVSGNYDTEPTVATLNAAAAQYLTDNNAGIPSINLTVSFVDLSSTEEYKDKAMLETVNLCDTVEVEFTKLGVSALAKVIKTTWNTLLDRYDSIEIGDAKANLAATIANIDNTIESIGGGIDEIEESIMAQVQRDIAQAVTDATERITGADGGYIKYHFNAQGEPTEMLIMNSDDEDTATKIWRWGINGLGFSADSGENYTSAFTVDGQGRGYLNTQFILASAISSAMIAAGAITTDKLDAGAVDTNKLSVSTKELLSQGEQYIYKSKANNNAEAAYTTWVVDNTGGQNKWTTNRPEYNASYPYCFIAKQKKDAAGTVTCTTPVIDNTTTTIDGGHIKTGIISDPNNRNSINMLTGAFTLANGAFQYVAGDTYVRLSNNLSLRLNNIPLAGQDITADITAAHRYITFDYLKVIKTPYMVYVYLKGYISEPEPLEQVDIIDLPITANTPDNIGVVFGEAFQANKGVFSGIMVKQDASWSRLYANGGGSYYSATFSYII